MSARPITDLSMRDLRQLTLEQKVGQLFVIGFQGTALGGETLALLARLRPAGAVFTQRNIRSLDQIHDLNTQFAAQCDIAPFLIVEQEGGTADRLKQAVAPVPSLGDLADVGTGFVRSGAKLLAGEVRAAGFNTNLSPSLDLGLASSVLRPRSLAGGAAEVTRIGRLQLDEFERKQLLSVASHFPGLGGAQEDPHFVLPRIRRTRRELLTEDVVPFNELASRLDLIRVSHGHYAALGDLRPIPASLSRRVVTDILRGTVGFEGVIMTDDLTMGAITAGGLTPQTFLDAINAGNDMVMFSQATPLVEDAFNLIVQTASGDARLRKQIDASLERILYVKRKLDFTPVRNRAHSRARLVRQIKRLKASIPDVERLQVR